MKKLLVLVLLVFGVVWFYFWYVRGVNLLLKDAEEAYLPPHTSFAVRLRPTVPEDAEMMYVWSSGTAMPTPRTDVGAANIGNRIYVVGGIDSLARVTDNVEVYDASGNVWSFAEPLPEPLYHVSLVSFDGSLYAIGGFDGLAQTPVDSVYMLDPKVGSWVEQAPLPNAVGGAASVVRNGKIHVIGGRLGTGIGDSYFIYDPAENVWSYGDGLLSPRAFHGAASLGDRIIVFGGRSGSLAQNLRTIEVLMDGASTWEKGGFMNFRRSSFGFVPYDGKLYVFGGETTTAAMDTVEVYDPVVDTWSEAPEMPTGRHGVAAVAVHGKIFVIGGGLHAGISVSDANEVFIPQGYLSGVVDTGTAE
jgi:N-acetylneuraminic acid mutarotase